MKIEYHIERRDGEVQWATMTVICEPGDQEWHVREEAWVEAGRLMGRLKCPVVVQFVKLERLERE